MYPDQRRSSSSSGASSSNLPPDAKAESQSPSQGPPHPPAHHQPSHQSAPNSQHSRDRERERDREHQQHQSSKSMKSSSSSQNSMGNTQKSSSKDSKAEEKEVKVKQEGQKPTMETQGPPPPPTSQYYLHPSYMNPSPFGFDPSAHHTMYRNMMVPGAAYNTAPYHLQMARFHAPEDLSRNPNPKALDILQHHANQAYYNPHKIHELSERALKSPTSNVKTTVSSPGVPQPPSNNINSTAGHGPMPNNPSLQPPPPSSLPPGAVAHTAHGPTKGANSLTNNVAGNDSASVLRGSGKHGPRNELHCENDLTPGKDGPPTGRSPPPQRHVHTHHHTHVGVGLGYPMYSAAYGGEC